MADGTKQKVRRSKEKRRKIISGASTLETREQNPKGWGEGEDRKKRKKKNGGEGGTRYNTEDCWWWYLAGKLCVIANTNLTFASNTSPGRNFPNCKNHRSNIYEGVTDVFRSSSWWFSHSSSPNRGEIDLTTLPDELARDERNEIVVFFFCLFRGQ